MATQAASASSSSSSSPSPSSSSPRWNYDVFLSFRGADTRNSFTDHLYANLEQRGINTFKDDEKLERGKVISPELLKAIEESQFAIIVMSRNYATSKWCLIELAKIIECKKKIKMTVLPIFYHVERDEVQHQTGTIGEAFVEHEKDQKANIEDVQTWKDALREVGNISGWHVDNSRRESIVIQEIIARIHGELSRKSLTASKDLFGIESRVKELLEKYLHMGLDDVRFVGICGMGGIGKTTITQVIHKRISYQFDASSFIANVREETENGRLVCLQEQLLSKILMKSEKLGGIHEGKDIMEKRLRKKKILIVLDDVNSEEQLEALAGEVEWFGKGSRIIITSRDKHLLKRHVMDDNIYEAKLLNDEEALQLFSWKAFKKYSPEKNFVGLSKYFVDYAKGLPLALKVLGCSLYSREMDAWKSDRDKLKTNQNSNIQNILRISYDKLQDSEKQLFLDIACFFKGEDRDRIRDILQSLGRFPDINIDVLMEKSLINIVGRKLSMHDLLQEMGKEIVCQESKSGPGVCQESKSALGGRSRLWFYEDVLYVLKHNVGTEAVQGIFLNTHVQKDLYLNAESFRGMKRMRLLKIGNVQLPEGLNYLPDELCVMEWNGYPLKSMPASFQPTKLVELKMHCSCITQLWKGTERSNDLKLIDLSDSKNLTETLDFNRVPNLERLVLQGCTRLLKIHPSIGALEQLILLNLQDCKSLNSLPSKISLKFLETLNLSGCSRLKKFPEIGENMTCLSKLYLDGTAIIELPPSFENLSGIILLSLRDCKNISILPSVICRLSSLKTLILSGCSRLDKMPENLSGMKCLEELDASKTAIREVPSSILHMTNLRKLSFRGCKDLPPKSWDLLFCCCLLLKESSGPISLVLPDSFSGLSSLVSLDLSDCNLLDGAIPNDLSSLSSLQSLNLSGNKFITLPDSICQLSMLRDLSLRNCSRLQALPKLPLSVLYVWAENCTSLETDSNQIHARTTSESIAIINCSGSVTLEEGKVGKCYLSNAQSNLLMQNLKAEIYQDKIICGSSMATEIPMWFKEQSTSSSITIKIQPDLDYGSKWLGYALLIVYEVHENENMNVGIFNYSESTLDLTEDTHQFACHFETNEGSLKKPEVLHALKVPFVGPTAIWGYIPHAQFSRLSNDLDKWTYIEVKITSIPGVVVKKCGARLLYQQDASEFVDTISQYSLGGLYGDHSEYHKLADFLSRLPAGSVGEAECTSSSTSLSSPVSMEDQLKRDFYPLLSKCFQVNYAQNKMYKYIFPIRASPPWFMEHGIGNSISISLPPNLNDVEGWIGFALYASFAVHDKHQTVSRDSKISRSFFCLLCTDDGCLQSFIVLPLTRDIFVESHRLLVLHIPRVFFTHKLNQRKSIRALFGGFNNSDMNTINSDVEVEVCGMRMVFEQDLEELVQRIFDCISSSPDIYHQGYRQGLEDQVKRLSGYVHAQEESTEPLHGNRPHYFDCSSSSQRMSQSMQKQHVGQRHFDSFEAYLGEPMARSEFRDSNLNMMQEGFDQTRVFNKCFPQREITNWFCCHNGSSMQTKLPQNRYNNPDWIGVALCAAFKFLKHPTLIHDNLRSEISHGLTCLIGSDVGWTLRLSGNITESEFNESIWFNQRVLIWVLYIPRVSILDKLKKFDRLDALFESKSHYLMVEKCGHSIVCQHNVESFEQMITQGSFTPPVISQPTHHVVQDNNRNNNKEASTSGTSNSSEPHHVVQDDNGNNNKEASTSGTSNSSETHHVVQDNNGNNNMEASTSGTRYSSETHHVVQDDNGNNNKEASTSGTSYSSERLKAPFYLGESSSTSNHPDVKMGENISKCIKFLKKHSKDLNPMYPYDSCFPPSEIPELFSHRGVGPSLTVELPLNLRNDSSWMGFALCASFSLQDCHSLSTLESEVPHHLICLFETESGILNPLHAYRTTKEELKLLHLRGFIWLSYIPYHWLSVTMKRCNRIKISIASDFPGWTVQKCAIRLVHCYPRDASEMWQITFHCATSFLDNWDIYREEVEQDSISGSWPENEASMTDFTILNKEHLKSLLLRYYELQRNFNHEYIFPRGEIPRWFSHQSIGPSVEIPLPPNLYNDEKWMGIAVCAVFPIPPNSRGNLDPKIFILHLDRNEGYVKPTIVFHLVQDIFVESHRLLVFYLPPMMFPAKLNDWNRICAAFECDIPSVEAKMCGIHLLYKQDLEAFVQTMIECLTASSKIYQDVYYQVLVQQVNNWRKAESSEHNPWEEEIVNTYGYCHILQRVECVAEKDCTSPETLANQAMPESTSGNALRIILPAESIICKSDSGFPLKGDLKCLLQKEFKGFDPNSTCNTCLPQTEIPEWFSHRSRGSSETIQLPPNLYDDSNWMGIALCAAFSVQEHPTLSLANLDSNVSHHLICQLDTDKCRLVPLHVHRVAQEKFTWFYLRGFIWLSHIPRQSLTDVLNQCNQLQASVESDCPMLTVQGCGLRLLYHQDLEEFEQTLVNCFASPFDNMDLIRQLIADDTRNEGIGSRKSFEDQHSKSDRDFDQCCVYNSCFPPCEILEWFSHHNNDHSVTFQLPPSFCNDQDWTGLALCASFKVDEHPTAIPDNLDLETSYYLTCHLETDIANVDPPHSYHLTKKDVMLLHLGGLLWLSYIPCESLQNWFNQCTSIEASFASDIPRMTVQKCGLRFVYQQDEVEFEHTIRQCKELSDKQNHDYEKVPSTPGGSSGDIDRESLRGPNDRKLKDKGKQIVE